MNIAVIAGDGIGKDVTAQAVKVLSRVGQVFGLRLELEHLPWSADHYLKSGETMPSGGYDLLRSFDAVFVGALGDPRVADNRHARDILLGTRFELDLYVNYRPVRLLADRLSPLKDRGCADIDFVVFRENTEGVYVSVGGRFKLAHQVARTADARLTDGEDLVALRESRKVADAPFGDGADRQAESG